MMDSILISKSIQVRDGLSDMLETAIGPHNIVQVFVPLQWALFIEYLAKGASDKEEWFPHGKWATIQALQGRIGMEIDKVWEGILVQEGSEKEKTL